MAFFLYSSIISVPYLPLPVGEGRGEGCRLMKFLTRWEAKALYSNRIYTRPLNRQTGLITEE